VYIRNSFAAVMVMLKRMSSQNRCSADYVFVARSRKKRRGGMVVVKSVSLMRVWYFQP
jgi:hypothetical protein